MEEDQKEMNRLFHMVLPNSLYQSHYELHQVFPDFTAEQWRRYIRDNDRFIMLEISAIAEADARRALQLLASGKASTQEISAVRQLLERSEQINQATKEAKTFVNIGFNIKKEEFDNGRITVETNYANAQKFYPKNCWRDKPYIKRNYDSTLHFTDLEEMDDLDRAYMRSHNPDNLITTTLEVEIEHDVQ